MVANNAAWAPSGTSGESKGNTPAQPATKTAPAVPEKPFTGKPAGVQWDHSKEAPRRAEKPTELEAPENLTPAEKKIWKIKVNGKDRDFDASDEAEIRRMVEKAYGADEAFQKSAKVSKDAETFFSMLKDAAGDPDKLAELLKHEQLGGADFDTLAEKRLWAKIQREKMTPEERKAAEIQAELAKYKAKEAEDKAKAEAQEQAQVITTIQKSFSTGMEAAHKAVGLQSNPQSIYRMAEYARDMIDQSVEPDFRVIAEKVKDDYVDDVLHYLSDLPDDKLADPRVEKIIKRLRKYDLDRLKTTTAEKFHAPARPRPTTKEGRSEPKLDAADWRAKLIRERS